MSLNSSAYPDFGPDTICPDFGRQIPDHRIVAERRMDAYVDRLDDWLDALDETAAGRIVVGHSFGGMLAMSWLLRHRCAGPAAISGLVLVATTAGPMFDVLRPMVFRFLGFRGRFRVAPLLNAWSRPGPMKLMKALTSAGRTVDVDFGALRDKSDHWVGLAGWRNTDWRAMQSYRTAMKGFDVRAELDRLEVPTIILHGSRDTLFPTSVGRQLQSAIPGAALEIVPGAQHTLPLTHPETVSEAVTRLLLRGPPYRHSS